MSDVIAIAALTISLLVGVPTAYSFFLEVWKRRKPEGVEKQLLELERLIGIYQIGSRSMVSCVSAVSETLLISHAIYEEMEGQNNAKLNRADPVFLEQRAQLVKLMHHARLAQSDDAVALSSSWALATEFGDADTVDLMTEIEGFRGPENLTLFRQHKRLLLARLRFKSRRESNENHSQ